MIKVLRGIMERVYEDNHSLIEDIVHKDYEENDITVYFYQDKSKITLTALKESTQYQIDLAAKKYSKLFDRYREVGEVTYKYTERKVIIELKGVSKIADNKVMTPEKNRTYGYCRVSSKGQLDNNSLEQQAQEIRQRYLNVEIQNEQYTGSTVDRPILNNVVFNLKVGDTLVVTKLDRLARTTKEGIEIIEELLNRGVTIEVLNMGRVDNTPMGSFFLKVLLAVSEMERSMIIERTQAGKAIARTKDGFKEGRPKKFKEANLEYAISLLSVNGGTMSYKEVVEATGISKSTLIRAQRKRN